MFLFALGFIHKFAPFAPSQKGDRPKTDPQTPRHLVPFFPLFQGGLLLNFRVPALSPWKFHVESQVGGQGLNLQTLAPGSGDCW